MEMSNSVNELKNVHGLQLALKLADSEIRRQIFDTLDTNDLKGEAGWTAFIELFKQHEMDAFETWRKFKHFCRKDGQTVDDYIMCYEKYKAKMRRFKMDLGQHIHGLNRLCAANLSDAQLRIAMREVHTEYPNEM